MFLLCLSTSCVPHVASFYEVSIFDCPFGILLLLFTSLAFFNKHYKNQFNCNFQIKITHDKKYIVTESVYVF